MGKDVTGFIKSDLQRYEGKPSRYIRKLLILFRKAHNKKSKFLSFFYNIRYFCQCRKHGIEISSKVNIGPGLYIGHPYNITINDKAVLGSNINIHKGVTIGQENRGSRKGVPHIGNNVWIGVNATIVGAITIGDDVMIAPNSFVNFDVPSHSIVIGNPGKLIHRDNATEGYINNCI